MKNKKIKNVLITTLSTLQDKNTINYYFCGDQKKYICNGISSLEAGSKYILSTVPIDKIVVIGSDETHSINDNIEETVNLLALKPATASEISAMSPYGFYKQRIAAFCKIIQTSTFLPLIMSCKKEGIISKVSVKQRLKHSFWKHSKYTALTAKYLPI